MSNLKYLKNIINKFKRIRIQTGSGICGLLNLDRIPIEEMVLLLPIISMILQFDSRVGRKMEMESLELLLFKSIFKNHYYTSGGSLISDITY